MQDQNEWNASSIVSSSSCSDTCVDPLACSRTYPLSTTQALCNALSSTAVSMHCSTVPVQDPMAVQCSAVYCSASWYMVPFVMVQLCVCSSTYCTVVQCKTQWQLNTVQCGAVQCGVLQCVCCNRKLPKREARLCVLQRHSVLLQCTTVCQDRMRLYIVESGCQRCHQHSAAISGLGCQSCEAFAVLLSLSLSMKSICPCVHLKYSGPPEANNNFWNNQNKSWNNN